MGSKPLTNAKEVMPGDIISELKDGYELGRYLVLYRVYDETEAQWPWYTQTDPEPEKTTFFVCYMLYVGRKYSSIWSQRTDPGDIYHLSIYGISTHHQWEKLVDSGLSWHITSETNESG